MASESSSLQVSIPKRNGMETLKRICKIAKFGCQGPAAWLNTEERGMQKKRFSRIDYITFQDYIAIFAIENRNIVRPKYYC